jgi:hypothetical protein
MMMASSVSPNTLNKFSAITMNDSSQQQPQALSSKIASKGHNQQNQ